MLNYECQTYLACRAKETEDEKCLSFKAHNPKVSLCKAATIVSCETNSTSVEFQRFTLSNHRSCSALLLLKVTDSTQLETCKEREPGRFLWGHATSKLFIWTVCPPSAADGTKRAVKNEAWSCDLWHPNAESRCSSTSSASVFHLTHLHSSVECPCCSSETVLRQKSLFCHDIHSWQNLQKNQRV